MGVDPRPPRSLHVALAVCVVLHAAPIARADPGTSRVARCSVSLVEEGPACPGASTEEVAAILRVELLDRFVGAPERGSCDVVLSCSGDVVTATVSLPGGGTKTSHADLARVPSTVRSRIVALTIAELVRDIDENTSAALAPSVRIEPERARAVPVSPPLPVRVIELGPFAEASAFPAHGLWLAGGGLRFVFARGPWCAGLEAGVLAASERFEPGTVQEILSYGSPFLGLQGHWRSLWMRAGAGYALGAATIRGSAEPPAVGGTMIGPFSAPYAFGELELLLFSGVRLYARGQLGWVTSSMMGEVAGGSSVSNVSNGSNVSGVTIGGAWMGGQLGFAVDL